MTLTAIFFMTCAMFAAFQTVRVSKRFVQTIRLLLFKENMNPYHPFSWTISIHLLLGRLGLLVLTIGTGLDNMRHALECISSLLWPIDAELFFLPQPPIEATFLLKHNTTTSGTTILWDHYHHHDNSQVLLQYFRSLFLYCAYGHYVLTPIAMFSITQLFCSSWIKCSSRDNQEVFEEGPSSFSSPPIQISSHVTKQETNTTATTRSLKTPLLTTKQENNSHVPSGMRSDNCHSNCGNSTISHCNTSATCLGLSSIIVCYMIWFQSIQYANGPAQHPIQIELSEQQQQQQQYQQGTNIPTTKYYSFDMKFSSREDSMNGLLGVIAWQLSLILLFGTRLVQVGVVLLHRSPPINNNTAKQQQDTRMIIALVMLLIMNVCCVLWHALKRSIVKQYCRGNGNEIGAAATAISMFLCDGGWITQEVVTNFAEQLAIRSHIWIDHLINNKSNNNNNNAAAAADDDDDDTIRTINESNEKQRWVSTLLVTPTSVPTSHTQDTCFMNVSTTNKSVAKEDKEEHIKSE